MLLSIAVFEIGGLVGVAVAALILGANMSSAFGQAAVVATGIGAARFIAAVLMAWWLPGWILRTGRTPASA